ncbi:MAG: DNA polymerase, partial [bacterium]|nr:DNA polymerase [bacterium]
AYKEYKAGRKKAEPELVRQIIRSKEIFEAFSIPMYEMAGFEADDIIGTIVEQMKDGDDINIVIASGDMDTLQLVRGKEVQVFTLRKGIADTILYDEKAVSDRFGFSPSLLPDYKGLRGDPSDNIIGIAGVGEKTASILIENFGSLEEMYETLKKNPKEFERAGIKPRIIGLLEAGEEEALFSKTLAEIRRDAPISFSLGGKEWKEGVDIGKITELFTDLEFRALVQRARELYFIKETSLFELKQEEAVAPEELKKTALALWLVDSNITNPGLDDILNFGRVATFQEAKKIIFKELEKRKLTDVYEKIELPLIPVIEKMEERGIKVDTLYLTELSKEYHRELDRLEKEICEYAGETFNLNSPRQLGVILFEKLGLKLKNHKKTTTGVKSTRESELEKMQELHPIIPAILHHREFQKLLSTYIDNMPHMLGADGRLHTTFQQTGTTTGRLSSINPNLQNIPIKSELGRKIRRAFVAAKGMKFVALDYSQIELRVAAFLSKDEKLLQIFREGRDVHTEVAAQVFKVSADKVTSEMRRRAKVINFGILYGMGVNALRENLGTGRDEAQTFYNEYFASFPGIAAYLARTKEHTEAQGFTETFFGRRRYFQGINSHIPYIKAMAERMAVNAPIQGTESDIIKLAMIETDSFITKQGLGEKAYLLLQVHDELVYEVADDYTGAFIRDAKRIMENIVAPEKIGGITLVAEGAIGSNWAEIK